MHERSEIALRRALKHWQSRQRNDGCLASILVFVSALTTLRFVFSPGAGTAFVMGLFLLALVVSCLRLLSSAAKVVEIRKALFPTLPSDIIDVEVLTPAEHQADPEPASNRDRYLVN
jgi:hypothetical protein